MTKNNLKIIISGGGTGGHIYPAIALADALQQIQPSTEILFVGAKGKMEMEKVPQAGYKIIGLPIRGISRNFSFELLKFPFQLIQSLIQVYRVFKDFTPDVVIGVGGYASGPTLIMAKILHVPYLIQEQNSYAGITNRYLGKWAKKVAVAYPNMERFFGKKALFTGNPVRNDILEITSKKEKSFLYFGLNPDKKTILILGGSQGAKSINEAVAFFLEMWVKKDYQILWQTGKNYITTAQKIAEKYAAQVCVRDFITEMDCAYAVASIVVSRAGALSVSEICLAKKAAIFIPFPFATDDHQTKNTQALVEKKAAWMLLDSEVREKLGEKVIQLFENNEIQTLEKNTIIFAKPKAAQEIAQEIIALVR